MSNIMEYESISEKIKGLEIELDTFIQAVHEIKEIRRAAGTLPDDLERNKAEIEERKKELEKLITSANEQLANFEQQAGAVISDLEKKNDARIKRVEKRFFKVLTRQRYAIVIMSALYIAGMSFFGYLFFMQ